MDQNLLVLYAAAVSIALIHTLFGPDHYVPFVAMSKAGGWSLRKTMVVTMLSGLGHVGSSVLLGFVGIGMGAVLTHVENVEEMRGKVAGWLLILFGFAYLSWGILYSRKHRPHLLVSSHHDSHHAHDHDRNPHSGHSRSEHRHSEHSHDVAHGTTGENAQADPRPVRMTPWILFTVFVFGPCEPLIPLLMYPAARSSYWGVIVVTLLFSLTTIATMLAVVLCLVQGTKFLRYPDLHQYGHALAGMVVMLCGIAINFGL